MAVLDSSSVKDQSNLNTDGPSFSSSIPLVAPLATSSLCNLVLVSTATATSTSSTVQLVAPSATSSLCKLALVSTASATSASSTSTYTTPSSVSAQLESRVQDKSVVTITCLPSILLSPNAVPFSPVSEPTLFPPGKDKFGRTVLTAEDSEMLLDYFEEAVDNFDLPMPMAKPDIPDTNTLRKHIVALPDGREFLDRVLPAASEDIVMDVHFPPSYFLNLHNQVKQGGTYNYAGARVCLQHCKINVSKFRSLLTDYEDIAVLQFLEFGFPLGIAQEFELESCTQNHSSALEFFRYVDSFFHKEVLLHGVTGPMTIPPFPCTKVSPLMTAVKKPGSRRPVFDASYGELSINNNTPEKEYLGESYQFTFPTVLDLAKLIVKLGPGCLLWKRDLSRWFMQLPVDPGDYDKLGVIWRGMWYLFIAYVWGCRHAGYSGQRVSSAVLHIFKDLGAKQFDKAYNAMVYMDDFAGAEVGERATSAFNDMGSLLADLGIIESEKKALSPSTQMIFLGVEFDTVKMCMRIGEEKRCEVKATVNKWFRRTVATKEELQSLQGQLMWISKVVRFSRIVVTRVIAEQKSLKSQKQKTTLSHHLKKDLLWWKMFLDMFNGVELIIPNIVSCNILGDATLAGAGAWNRDSQQYWSRKFPRVLQSPDFPIHQKEFITVILEAKVWGDAWSGKRIAIHCDNVAVVQSINFLKPKDPEMQRCLREFLYYVTKFKFEPVMVWIPTKENHIADFISRNHNPDDIKKMFAEVGLPDMKPTEITDEMFNFIADW